MVPLPFFYCSPPVLVFPPVSLRSQPFFRRYFARIAFALPVPPDNCERRLWQLSEGDYDRKKSEPGVRFEESDYSLHCRTGICPAAVDSSHCSNSGKDAQSSTVDFGDRHPFPSDSDCLSKVNPRKGAASTREGSASFPWEPDERCQAGGCYKCFPMSLLQIPIARTDVVLPLLPWVRGPYPDTYKTRT